jgi:UDP-N-acetylmuramate--alanine ligase
METKVEPKHIHFIGIGGIGMSGLARLFLHDGKNVSGSDVKKTANTERLEAEGATIFYTQVAENITSKGWHPLLDLVVYTEAVAQDNPELVAARALGIRCVNYFEALGEVANEYYLIAVSGTHGKTTTTAMLIDIFEEASFDPSAIVGSLRSKTGSNYRAGKSKYFIVEACEYRRDFLTLKPDVLVITNIELEHVDYYKDLADVQSAFAELAHCVPEGGAVIANVTDPNVVPVLANLSCTVIDYRKYINLTLKLHQPGLHNRQNAAAASAAASFVGIEESFIESALVHFAGTARRFEYKGDIHGALVYDDYAHHPTELRAAIAGVRELYPDKKLTVVFQPHTFSRTQELFADFVEELAKCDHVLLLPVYAAREEAGYTTSSMDIESALLKKNVSAKHFMTHEACALSIKESATGNDVIFVMGAGDVTRVATLLVT